MITRLILGLVLVVVSTLLGYLVGCGYTTDHGLLTACILIYHYISPDQAITIAKSLRELKDSAESDEEAQYYSEKAAIFTDFWLLGKFYQTEGCLLEDLINDTYFRKHVREMLKRQIAKKDPNNERD